MKWALGARQALGTAVAAISLFGVTPAPAAATSGAPLAVVRQYLRTLARHDAHGVCATFSPALIAFNARWEAGTGRSCVRRVAYDHFSRFSPGHIVTRIRIIRVTGIDTGPPAVGVHLILWYRFTCQSAVSAIPGCRPHFERIPDVIYLRSERGRWRIVKPGRVYENTSMSAAPWLDALAPPGDSSTVNRPAAIGPPPLSCPSGGIEARNRRRVLDSESGGHSHLVPAARAPWLYVSDARFVWLAGDQLCVTITLGAPPRADSAYAIDLAQPQAGGELQHAYGVEVGGTGALSVQLHDSRDQYRRGHGPCPTAFGLSGNVLTMIVSPGDRAYHLDKPTQADASTMSLQTGEPLINHPLDASSMVPSFDGLTLPPPGGAGQPRCVPLHAP